MERLILMLQSDLAAANAFGALASAAAAFLALVASIFSVIISVKTASAQRVHNELTVRPLASISVGNYENCVYVRVVNNGTGPMILKGIAVSDGKVSKDNVIDWMPNLPLSRPWTDFSKNFHLRSVPAGGQLNLIELSADEDEDYVGKKNFSGCRDLARTALAGLTVNVEYTDIYGKAMPPMRRKLDWFASVA